MAIAPKLQNYLRERSVEHEIVTHPRSEFSMETAEKAHVHGDALAKGVLVEGDDGYLLVVVPADYVVELGSLRKLLGKVVGLAVETDLGKVFDDCEFGAVPPIGMAYDVRTIWDPSSSLASLDEVFFEAGDHETLVRMSGTQFHELMAPAERGDFSHLI